MRYFASFGTFAKYIDALAVMAAPRMLAGVDGIGRVLYRSVYNNFGASEKFVPLAESTQQARAHRWGYYRRSNVADATLLWSGHQRGEVILEQAGDTVGVGSPDKIMLAQELGTAKISPRPLFKISAREALPDVREIAYITVGKMIGFT